MSAIKYTPIIIGVGDVVNRSQRLENALEPLELILQAIKLSIEDTGLEKDVQIRLQQDVDSIDIVQTWTWPYADLPGLIASKLGARPRHKHYSDHGGNQPAKLLDDASRRIARGQAKVAIVTGGEALASLTAFAKAGKMPPPGWTKSERAIESVFSPTTRELHQGLGSAHEIGAPIHIYPLYENGFRALRKQSIKENHEESAQLYAEFAQVAEKNPQAWNYGKAAKTAKEIGTVSKQNRMICFPYPLLMNAFNTVDLAGACLVTSTEYARKLGIPEARWIYPVGGAGTRDCYDFWERPNYHSCPALSRSLDAALQASCLRKDDIDLFDFYSCFPIVPKLACHHLGLPITASPKPITLLGGLTSFGGAGNNYSMHAITEMVRKIRQGSAKNGVVLANGGWLTYQHVVCLSSKPRRGSLPYPESPPLPEVLPSDAPPVDAEAEGEAVIETYTVEFNRDNTPLRGHVVGRLASNNHRFLANHGDEATLKRLASNVDEPIGKKIAVRPDQDKAGRNIFTFESVQARL